MTYQSQAREMLKAVILPLDSLPIMQRAIATSPESNASEVPALALLNEPLKTHRIWAYSHRYVVERGA
jgi:hypothetical protein